MKRILCLTLLSLCVAQARAGGVFNLGSSFNVNVTNDPNGNSSSTNPVTLNTGTTSIDGGLLNVSVAIANVSSSTAWIQITVSTPNNSALVGTPSGSWDIDISGIQTNGNATLGTFYTTFEDANGNSYPFPYGTTTFETNPSPFGTEQVSAGSSLPNYTTSQELYASINPFNQGPTNYGSPGGDPMPTTYIIGGEYTLQPTATPEPASLTLLGLGGLGLAGYGWRRRKLTAAV